MEPNKALCPHCEGSSLSCDLCHGAGVVTWDTYWDFIDDILEGPAFGWQQLAAEAELAELADAGAVAV